MKVKRIIGLITAAIIALAGINMPGVNAADNPAYLISGSASGSDFTATVSVKNIVATGGRIAVGFDTSKLELPQTDSFSGVLTAASGVSLSVSGNDPSVLLSNDKGRAMFTWYSLDSSGIDASASQQAIANISFRIKDGVTVDDFDRNTINLYYVNETMVNGWYCSAGIVERGLVAYRNNFSNSKYVCGIEYDYPNCDYIPIVSYDVSIYVTNYNNEPISAEVTLDNLKENTDNTGKASFSMANGVYAYRIASEGFEVKSGYIIVNDGDETVRAYLMTNAQMAAIAANELQIVYAAGDSRSSVTASMILPSSSSYGDVTWVSSNQNIVDNYGTVYRTDDDERVTLTATVTVGKAVETRDFTVTVKSRFTAEEKNMAVIAKDMDALDIIYSPGDSSEHVTADLTLKRVGANGCGIAWSSSNEEVIDSYGMVTRPTGEDVSVTLTALVMRGMVSDSKTFQVVVMAKTPERSSASIVQDVVKALEIEFSGNDTVDSVTETLNLPTFGAEDSVIQWTSSNPAVITPFGGVVRQSYDTEVTLTATVYNGTDSAVKHFTVTVKAADITPVNPENGKETDIEESNGIARKRRSDVAEVSRTESVQKNEQLAGGTGEGVSEQKPVETKAPEVDKKQDRFDDLGSVPWAKEAIIALADRGVINGTSSTTYSPQNNIRRGDFIMLLTKLLGLEGEITETFEDVTPDKYYYQSVSTAKSLGVVAGIDETHFNPEGNISRQDMMVMTYRALVKLGKANMPADNLTGFRDAANVSDYAYESVSHLVGGGYINGDDMGNINPHNNTTRAETAVFLYNLDI